MVDHMDGDEDKWINWQTTDWERRAIEEEKREAEEGFVEAIYRLRQIPGFDKMQAVPPAAGHDSSDTTGLFIGPRMAAINSFAMAEEGITHILSCTGQYPSTYGRGGDEMEVKLLQLEDTEDEDIERYFDETVKWMQQAIENDGKLLVFCQFGRSRSCTMCCAYLMYTSGCTWRSALTQVRKGRKWVRPNVGFMRQLQKYEERLASLHSSRL
jgi:protein-tyrosine phosphatase